jgi:uncharacterized membrane protein YczE
LLAAVLFTIAALFVLFPFYAFFFSLPRPRTWPYPFGDPVPLGSILIIANVLLFAVSWKLKEYGRADNARLLVFVKISIIGMMLGLALFAFTALSLTLPNLVYFSIALFLVGLLGFTLIPP